MSSTLLSHLAHTLAPKPEEVATRALAYFLNAHIDLPRALWGLLHGSKEYGWQAVSRFQPEHAFQGEGGRVDVAGIAQSGYPLLIEGKFWAGLTSNQPDGYLAKLLEGQDLVFVVPRARVTLLAAKLAESWSTLSAEHASRTDDAGRHLHVVSWQRVLDAFKSFLPASEHALRAEIDQVLGLCARMDAEGFLPLAADDLDPVIGRKIYMMSTMVDKVVDLIKQRKNSPLVKIGKDTPWGNAQSSGRSMALRGRDTTIDVYFSVYRWSTIKDSPTPFWVDVKLPESGAQREQLVWHLESINARFLHAKTHMAIPIYATDFCGLEENEVAVRFATFLEDIAADILKLNIAVSKGAEPELVLPAEEKP